MDGTGRIEGIKGAATEIVATGMNTSEYISLGHASFVYKEEIWEFWMCIDYRGLSNVTIKNKYPLPLFDEPFDQL